MSTPNSRKRPAPGASPLDRIGPMSQPYGTGQPDQRALWNGAAAPRMGVEGANFGDATSMNVNQYGAMMSPLQPPATQFGQGVPAPSMALARRGLNQALVQTGSRSAFDPSSDSWNTFSDGTAAFLQPNNETAGENASIEAMEERAKRVLRDAAANKKSIPPFVQKLASFLESSQNGELIRWNEAGDGFIVLDEDEFARTLIPELFKHNNYASFVRQLNMYGFHKRVGLSDNSMKASERKNKAPSEYYNPYFKRGHPNLLWLINKPKTASRNTTRKAEKAEVTGSDDDGAEDVSGNVAPAALQSTGEVAPLQKRDIVQVKSQLEKLQSQQSAISTMLSQLRKEHAQLFSQALAFQDQHNRHETSINAILNFLANVFRKSLEEQGGVQNMQELLASIIPNAQSHGPAPMPHQQRNVVELGDLFNQRASASSSVSPPKRQQRLLLGPQGKASTVSPSSTAPATPQTAPYQGHTMGSVTELFDPIPEASSPAQMQNELQSNPHAGMMKIIQDTNAGSNAASHLDLPNVAANTSATMTDDQRAKMLHIMSGQTTQAPMAPAMGPSTAHPPQPETSLSPLLSSMPPPNIEDLQDRSNQFDALQRLTDDNATGIAELNNMLGPLSPTGHIPGLDAQGNPGQDYFDNVDLDQYLNSNAYPDLNYDANFAQPSLGGADGNDFNFGLDDAAIYGNTGTPNGGYESGKVLETMDTPSTTTAEDFGDGARNDPDSPDRDAKRRRRA